MTITTDMLLAAGCEIWKFEGGRRAFSHDNWLVAYEVGDEWQLINYRTIQEKYPVRPRFRVKAKSAEHLWDNAIFTNRPATRQEIERYKRMPTGCAS